MPFKKGISGNPNGRRIGSKNKAGSELRERIAGFLTDHFQTLVEDFQSLPPQDRHKIFTSLLPYCLGKKQDLTIENQLEQLTEEQLDEVIETLKNTGRDE